MVGVNRTARTCPAVATTAPVARDSKYRQRTARPVKVIVHESHRVRGVLGGVVPTIGECVVHAAEA